MPARLIRLAVAMLALSPLLAAAPTCEFKQEGSTVRLTTDRYAMTFELGALTGLTNRLTGEVYTVSGTELTARMPHLVHGLGTQATVPADKERELTEMHPWDGGYRYESNWLSMHHPGKSSAMTVKPRGTNRLQVTWRGLEGATPETLYPKESYTLDLEVLPTSGELQVTVTAVSDTDGVFGNGFLMANFRKNLRFVLPETNGFSFVPGDKPEAGAVHWPYPWHAALVIGEGEKGAFGLWMADPEMKDRYLHKRNNPNCYDVMFESVNDAPFAAARKAVSRPIRINVYRGNWLQPATAFRDWWAEAFKVKPLAEREPRWLRDVAFACQHYEPPPKEMIPRTLFWAPQHWKVAPKIGDGGLFPYDIEKGPELDALKNTLPNLKANNGHVMVYLNINHMNEGHPWAGKYWKQRLKAPFGKQDIERDPKFEAPGSFQVNSAFKPWQDLILWWAEESYRRYGIDGFYLDCAAGTPNSLGGLIKGKNDAQGEVELMKRLKAAIPQCWLGVEYATEVTATMADTGFVGYDSWWPGSLPEREKNVHPIIGFLFNRYLHLWYCSGSDPVFDEVIGRLPHTTVKELRDSEWVTDYAVPEPFGAYFARLRWQTSIRPVYPENWAPEVRAYYADPAGNQYRILTATPREAKMVKTDAAGKEELVYWRIKDRTEAVLNPGTGIDGWIAYRNDSAIGLNPQAAYLYTSAPRITDWEITALPEGSMIAVTRPYKDGMLTVELKTVDGQERAGFVELLTPLSLTLALNRDGQVELEELGKTGTGGRNHYRVRASVPGAVTFCTTAPTPVSTAENKPSDLLATTTFHYAGLEESGRREPIARARLPQVDTRTGTLLLLPSWEHHGALDWLLELPAVPAGRKLVLRFGTLIQPHEGNTAQLRVEVNGREVLGEKLTGTKTMNPTPQRVDLTPFAGKKVLLSLQAWNCYLFNWLALQRPEIAVE